MSEIQEIETPEIVFDETRARKVVEDYAMLLNRLIEVVSAKPFYHYIEEDSLHLWFEGEDVKFSWAESDYDHDYGHHTEQKESALPVWVLFISNETLKGLRDKVIREEQARKAKADAEAFAREREQAETRDQAEYVRLKAKYEGSL